MLIGDIITMRRQLAAVRPDVDRWGFALNVPLLLGGLAFALTLEGALVLVTELLSLMAAAQIHARRPLSRLMGLCHVWWLPTIPALVYLALTHEHGVVLELWLSYCIAVMSLSVVFDCRDVYRYFTTANKTYGRR